LALDAKLRVKEARAQRYKAYDAKRKNLVEELEERERAHKKARVQKQKEELEAYHQTERIKEEGRRLREEREKALKEKEREAAAPPPTSGPQNADGDLDMLEPPPLDQFDTTVRLKYSLKSHPDLTSKETIAAYLAPFGAVDIDSIVFSMKTKTKSKSKSKSSTDSSAPTHATALVPFKNISDAYASVCASASKSSSTSTMSRGVDLKDMDITWVNNKEPLILGWLRNMGKLPTPSQLNASASAEATATPRSEGNSRPQSPPLPQPSSTAGPLGGPPGSTPFSSFVSLPPSLVVSIDPNIFPPQQPNLAEAAKPVTPSFSFNPTAAAAPTLDYESMTLLRLRQAERERLEREIREREAAED